MKPKGHSTHDKPITIKVIQWCISMTLKKFNNSRK